MREALIKALGGVTREEHEDAMTELGAYDTLAPNPLTAIQQEADAQAAHARVKRSVPGYRDGIPSINNAINV